MARRISAMFSSKDEGKMSRSSAAAAPQIDITPPASPIRQPKGKLTKSPTNIRLDTNLNEELDPPPLMTDTGATVRPMSRDGRNPVRHDTGGSRNGSGSRPQTPTFLGVPGTSSPVRDQSPASTRVGKRRSWLGKGDKNTAVQESAAPPPRVQAWIAGLQELMPYDLAPLLNGERVMDIWDEQGDVLVYIYPQNSGKGPCFKVNSELFVDSRTLSYLAQPAYGDLANGYRQTPSISFDPTGAMAGMSLHDQYNGYQRPYYETQTKSVHLPLGLEGDLSSPGSVPQGDDLELVVLYRNFFAFLSGGALISTQRQNSLYAIFMGISSILRRLQYGNEKGSSWGAVPWASFSRYTDELRLADVRSSREKNVEAILLGEAMKSWPLYVEGFAHAVGRLDDIKSINSPKFNRISPITMNRMERACMDLQQRLQVMRTKLDNFYFPSMFAGIANSQTATEAKLVRFKIWKASFMDFRSFTMAYYKKKYGSWPPKASSKKNDFEESGLNRRLIRQVYGDFTDLYDLLVDRASLTARTVDMPTLADDAEGGSNETIQHAIRSIESEYDRSTPPVMPPIPFDVPLIPSFDNKFNQAYVPVNQDTQSGNVKLKDNNLNSLLLGSINRDSIKSNPWIQSFMEYERKSGHGKSVQELVDARCGQWLFVYAVLQAMPMLVVDARDLTYTDDVEYFLCEAPRGGRPWMKEDTSASRSWYNVASGGGMVSLPADLIDHSVEGIYRRSYCWTIANKWAEKLGPLSPVNHSAPPPMLPQNYSSPFMAPVGGSAGASPYGSPHLQPIVPFTDDGMSGLPRISSRTSMHMGLQEVAAPSNPSSRPASSYNPNITFENFLPANQLQQTSGKKGRK